MHLPCGLFANASEAKALHAVDQAIRRVGREGTAYVLTNLTHPNLHGQADEIDMVVIGPSGSVVIEVKHWDGSALKRHRDIDAAAELIVAKAKRIAGRLKVAEPSVGFVPAAFLFTREAGSLKRNGQQAQHAFGVRAYSLKDLDALIADATAPGRADPGRLAAALAPRQAATDPARPKRLARFDGLQLLTPEHERFARVYAARDPWNGDRVNVHLYDLSAAPDGETAERTERRARREFDVVRKFQKSPHLPGLVDSWQALPNYAGEVYFFSLADSSAPSVAELVRSGAWSPGRRHDFVRRAFAALAEFAKGSEPGDPPLVHRALDNHCIRIRADGTPLFAGWRWARLAPAQTVSGDAADDIGAYAAPEVTSGGLAAATPASDVFSLCKVLLEASCDNDEMAELLKMGLAHDPSARPTALEFVDFLTEAAAPVTEPAPDASPSPAFWDEGHVAEWKGDRYRVLSVLGQGGAGRTFKLEQLDRNDEPIGTYVGKVVFNAELGPASLDAYRRLRPLTQHEGLSNVLACSSEWRPSELMALLRWVQGAPLDSWRGDLDFLADQAGDEGVEALALRWFASLCNALNVLHAQGWLHGDVSPSNILVDENRVVLIDYDLAGASGSVPASPGTALYASPERREGKPALARDDLYGLAATFYHVLTDRAPPAAVGPSGLPWFAEERTKWPTVTALLDKAIAQDPEMRFRDAADALRWLLARETASGSTAPAPPFPELEAGPLRPNVVDRVKDILSAYPGSRFGNAETRGLDTAFAFDTYVRTALDTALPEAIRSGRVSLAILCGNAGDGKTAFLQNLVRSLGEEPAPSSQRVWEGRLSGRPAKINLDGAASWNGRSANELLDELFGPFLDGPIENAPVHLVAVNDGRLMEWIDHAEAIRGGPTPLTAALMDAIGDRGDHLPEHVRLVELNKRSLVGGIRFDLGTISTDFVDSLIDRLVGGEQASDIWRPCRTCTARERCPMRRSAEMMGASDDVHVRARGNLLKGRLTEALQAVHLRNEVHVTARELKATISYVLFGLHACEDLHRLPDLDLHDPADQAFDPDSPKRQGELLRELTRLDPALHVNARVDRYLVAHGAPDPAHGAQRFRDGTGRPLPLRQARRRAFFAWSADQVKAIGGDEFALSLRDGRHSTAFRCFPLLAPKEQEALKARLCAGLSRLEALPDPAYRDAEIVPIRIVPRTPTETAFWVEKPLVRFGLAPERFQSVEGLETLHRYLVLSYDMTHGAPEELIVSLELYTLLMELADGVQILDAFSDDIFANLSVFTRRLAQEDERTLRAWSPAVGDAVHRLSVEQDRERQTVVLSEGIA
ncbi:NERD domain-containing protein [Methylobacterium sp. J-043]|nr:NERD domain-containing protein [Methylobacterium sp. J-043]